MFHALSPQEYDTLAAHPEIRYGLAPSSHGPLAVAWWTDAAKSDRDPVCYLAVRDDAEAVVRQLRAIFPRNALVRDDARAAQFAAETLPRNEPVPILMKGTPFFLRIWQILHATKPGETLSYGELAALAGNPRASRAVGRAMSTNPVAFLMPCHRVLRSQKTGSKGFLGGYAYGLELKERLLAGEAASR